MPAGRDAGGGLPSGQPVPQVVGVIAPVGDDGGPLPDERLETLAGPGDVGLVPGGDGQVDRPARPVADKVQLAGQPAPRPADAPPVRGLFLTPQAAVRWTFTWLASIIRTERSEPSPDRASNTRLNTPAADHRL